MSTDVQTSGTPRKRAPKTPTPRGQLILAALGRLDALKYEDRSDRVLSVIAPVAKAHPTNTAAASSALDCTRDYYVAILKDLIESYPTELAGVPTPKRGAPPGTAVAAPPELSFLTSAGEFKIRDYRLEIQTATKLPIPDTMTDEEISQRRLMRSAIKPLDLGETLLSEGVRAVYVHNGSAWVRVVEACGVRAPEVANGKRS